MSVSPEDAVNAMLDAGNPETWKFQEDGPRVVGKLINADSAPTKHGQVPILTVEVNGTPRSVWLMHTSVRSQVRRLFQSGSLQFGDWIGIEHKGKTTGKDGTEYEDYDVRVLPIGENRGLAAFGPAASAPAALDAGEQEAEVVGESTWGGTYASEGGNSWAN